MLAEKVLICAVVKDVAAQIKNNIKHAIKTGLHFSQYHIIIYENNSQDNTKNILKQYTDKHISIISEDITDTELLQLQEQYNDFHKGKPTRIEQICFARNKVLQEINLPKYNHFTHVIWIDMDAKSWSIEGILSSFEKKNIWDVVYGNSYPYYDYFALRLQHNSFLSLGPEIMGERWWKELDTTKLVCNKTSPFHPRIQTAEPIMNNQKINQIKKQKKISSVPLEKNTQKQDLIPVLSAFNGIGIFKKDIFKQFSYHYLITDDVKHIYRNYIHSETYKKYQYNIEHHDTYASKNEKDTKSNIVWKYRESDKPIVCEHVPLNFSLIKHHYKIYINPYMTYTKYVSLKTKVHNSFLLLTILLRKGIVCIRILFSIFKKKK